MDIDFDPTIQKLKDGPLLASFRERIRPATEKWGLTWRELAELADPPLSGSYLGNLARYDGLNVSTTLANGLRDLVHTLEELEPGSCGVDFLEERRARRDSSQTIAPDESAGGEPVVSRAIAQSQITIEEAVRALRAYGFEVVLTAR